MDSIIKRFKKAADKVESVSVKNVNFIADKLNAAVGRQASREVQAPVITRIPSFDGRHRSALASQGGEQIPPAASMRAPQQRDWWHGKDG